MSPSFFVATPMPGATKIGFASRRLRRQLAEELARQDVEVEAQLERDRVARRPAAYASRGVCALAAAACLTNVAPDAFLNFAKLLTDEEPRFCEYPAPFGA